MPRVSALMPVCDDARHVGAAIHALTRQTLADIEILVIDRGARDRTPEIVADWAGRDERITLLQPARALGLAAALNYGMSACRAPLVAYCPANAIAFETRLERQAAWLDEHPFTALVGSRVGLYDDAGMVLHIHPPEHDEALRAALTAGPRIVPASLMWRLRDVDAVGRLATDPAIAGAELYELAVRVAARHRIETVPDTLCELPRAALARTLLAGARPAGPRDDSTEPGSRRALGPRGRIFVAIAAFADGELTATLADLFARASHPDAVTAGVCLVYDQARAAAPAVRTRADQVRIVHAHPAESQGTGWARHLAERLWRGEDYAVRLDAHARFADGWDERLLDQLARCDAPFPILTTHPCRYAPPRELEDTTPPYLAAHRFTDEGMLLLTTEAVRVSRNPAPTAFATGAFAAFPGSLLREVPADPFVYDAADPAYMVRAWTHGWDLFTPSERLVYHRHPADAPERTPTTARPDWRRLQDRGRRRIRHLLGMEQTIDADALEAIEVFGLGHARTLEEYEEFSGIDFYARRIDDRARAGVVNPRAARRPLRAAGSS